MHIYIENTLADVLLGYFLLNPGVKHWIGLLTAKVDILNIGPHKIDYLVVLGMALILDQFFR